LRLNYIVYLEIPACNEKITIEIPAGGIVGGGAQL